MNRKILLSEVALILGVIGFGIIFFSSSVEVASIGNIITFVALICSIISLITKDNSTLSLLIAVVICVVNLFSFNSIEKKEENLADKNLKNYTITFDTDGGNAISPIVVNSDSKLEQIVPVKSGYKFEYWTLNGEIFNLSGYVDSRIKGDITLKANYSYDIENPDVTIIKESHDSTEDGVINNRKEQSSSASASTSQPVTTPSSETLSQQNAVKKAKSYLRFSAFSREGLIEQLEFEGFPTDDAIYGVDHSGANWNEQAVKKAKSYLSYSSFSRSGLIEQLEFEGFTPEQAEYGVRGAGY